MAALKKVFVVGYVGIILMFGVSAFGLLAFTGIELWEAFNPAIAQPLTDRFNSVLKGVAMLTIALASLDLADTVIEEEFKREGHLSGTARTRRVLARFLVVVVVSLSIESLVAVSSSCTTPLTCCRTPPRLHWALPACWWRGDFSIE